MYILGSGVSWMMERYSYSCYFSSDLTICAIAHLADEEFAY